MLFKEVPRVSHALTAEHAFDRRADVLNHAPQLVKYGKRAIAERLLNPAAHLFNIAGNQLDCKGNAADDTDKGQKLSFDTSKPGKQAFYTAGPAKRFHFCVCALNA